MPVGNMVLLARELFQQTYTWSQVATVLASTTLYAAAAVAVAAKLFGQEAVLFADSRSYKALLARRHFEARLLPTASESLLLAALLFPASFYAQSLLASPTMDNFIRMLAVLAIIQFAGMLVALPAGVTWYLKVDLTNTFRLRMPPARAWLAVLLLGLSSWAVAHEVFVFQSRLLRPSQALTEFGRQIETQLASAPLAIVLLLLAAVPAVAEELFFRGFLLSGLRSSMHKWSALLLAGLVFGVFHFIVDRVPVTAMLGIVLGYICWQSNSIFPGMLMHAMHNGMAVLLLRMPDLSRRIVGTDPEAVSARHLPAPTIAVTLTLFLLGLALLASLRRAHGSRDPDVRKETPAPTEPA
jgi:ABC-2 type transport system permease protein/sodium transport system permease protein